MSEHPYTRLDSVRIQIPRDERRGMRTGVVVYASESMAGQITKDLALEQAMNVATLPGIVGSSLAMPDIHQGYGFPIGGVAATDWNNGVVSPGGVGFDINCGVRLVRTGLPADDVRTRMKDLINQIFRDIPCGTGGQGQLHVNRPQLDQVLQRGSEWMMDNGYGTARDLEHTEERGCLKNADPATVSDRAKDRGRPQLGTLGSGNHFVEVQRVQRLFDTEAARDMGLNEGEAVVLIHCGSRGLGHQVCTDFLAQMGAAMKRYQISVPDRQLACVPIHSPEGQAYLAAMAASANFAWANRQAIMHYLRDSFARIFGKQARLDLVYDVCHNMAKRERHIVDGVSREVLVHRKGATRAFPGQPVLIPGSMGTASWVLVGTEGAMRETFGSVCHGAGRLMSRAAARKGRDARQLQRDLEEKGILVRSESRDGILEEAPEAYKNVDEVIEVVHEAGLARKVARLRPMGVIKG